MAENEDQSTELSGGLVLVWLDWLWRRFGDADRV
jgi:hypothetical protein